MTTDAAALESPDGQMFCYRHPERETWLRCGRCDQPICTKCSVQGPVGSRCRQCGLRKNDPLSAFTPQQLALGIGVAVAGGAVAGFAGGYVGYLSIIVGFFVGRFTADFFTRVVGYRRGPVMLSILFGGILAGTILGFGLQLASTFAGIPAEYQDSIGSFLLSGIVPGVLISGGAAWVGAYQRLH